MAADLHIHIRTPLVTEGVMSAFFSNHIGNAYYDTGTEAAEHHKPTRTDLRMILDECAREAPEMELTLNYYRSVLDTDSNWRDDGTLNQDIYLPSYAFMVMCATPQVWVGEVSWLKAALFENGEETFVPNAVGRLAQLFDDDSGVIITDDFITRAANAMMEDNQTSYSVASPEPIVEFLQKHLGKRAFTISW